MKIQHSDIIKALKAAYQHISVRSAIVSHENDYRVVTNVGLLVNTRPPCELSDSQSHIFQMSLEHARRAEISSAGSSLAMLALTQRMFLDSTLRAKTTVEGRTFVEADLANIVDGILSNNEKSDFIEFIQLAGASKYLVERTPSRFNSIQIVDNYEFTHVSKAVDGNINMDSAKVLIADAYIENESEIHKLLEWCGKEKERLLLCCRGFSDDVIHTLAINRARGTLSAYALAFPFNENDANTLVDIATILGGDIVSSLKGQLISTVEPSSMPRVHHARLRGNVLELNDPSARRRTDHLVNNIREKLETCEIEAREPLEIRLKRLNGTTMIVRLKADIDHSLRYEKWDLALRTIRSAVRGVIEANDSEMWPNRKLVPLLSEATAYQYARKLAHKLDELSFIV